MNWEKKFRALSSLCYLIILASCAPGYERFLSSYERLSFTENPDYGNLNNWAAHPDKWDPSDSIPGPLKSGYQPDSSVDVFFLHPTTLTDFKDERANADLNDASLNAKTDYSSMLYQASAFNEYRVFAPRYRQAHIRSYFMKDTAAAKMAFEKAYQDIKNAFTYFLSHANQGRPVIIASHSQGSTHAKRLLSEFFDGKPLQQQLVGAWIIGMYIPLGTFQTIPLCQEPQQNGCYCAWRTFRIDYVPENVARESIPGSVINPLTWTTDSTYAEADLNKGAVLRNFNTIRMGVAGAQVGKGILWTERPRFPGSILMRTRNYHIGDINLYYMNIRENVRQRVAHYKQSAIKP